MVAVMMPVIFWQNRTKSGLCIIHINFVFIFYVFNRILLEFLNMGQIWTVVRPVGYTNHRFMVHLN